MWIELDMQPSYRLARTAIVNKSCWGRVGKNSRTHTRIEIELEHIHTSMQDDNAIQSLIKYSNSICVSFRSNPLPTHIPNNWRLDNVPMVDNVPMAFLTSRYYNACGHTINRKPQNSGNDCRSSAIRQPHHSVCVCVWFFFASCEYHRIDHDSISSICINIIGSIQWQLSKRYEKFENVYYYFHYYHYHYYYYVYELNKYCNSDSIRNMIPNNHCHFCGQSPIGAIELQ